MLSLEEAKNRACEIVLFIEELRQSEGDSITILCDNPDGPPNNAIECCGSWTKWTTYRYEGENILDCLKKATVAKREIES